MSEKKLGLFYDKERVFFYQFDFSKDSIKVLNSGFSSIDQDDSLNFKKKLLCFIPEGTKTKNVNVAVSGPDINYKILELPFLPDEEIYSALLYKLEAETSIPSAELVFDYYRLDELSKNGKNLYFTVFSEKSHMMKIIADMKDCGIFCKSIVPSAFALLSLSDNDNDKPYAIVSIGEKRSIVILVNGKKIFFAREFQIGTEDIFNSLLGEIIVDGSKISIDRKKSEEFLLKEGIPLKSENHPEEFGIDFNRAFSMVRPVLEKIGAEILRTFEYYKEQSLDGTIFNRVYFSGDIARIPNVCDYFNSRTDIVASLLTSKKLGMLKNSTKNGGLDICLGSVLVAKNSFNLIPFEFKNFFLRRMKKLFNFWAVSLSFLVILFGIYSLFLYNENQVDNTYSSAKSKFSNVWLRINSTADLPTGNLQKFLAAYNSPGENDRIVLVVNYLETITPSDIYYTIFDYDKDSSTFSIKGVVVKEKKKSALTSLVNALKKNKAVKSIDILELNESDRYTVPVLDFELKCALYAREQIK